MINYRDESRKAYGTQRENLTLEQLNTGALLRIADATEKACADREALERQLKQLRQRHASTLSELSTEKRRTAALRGVINRMKREQE